MTPEFSIDPQARPAQRRLVVPSLLVATLELQETQFRRSVILIAENSKAGSLGFIINRPSPVSLSQIFSDELATADGSKIQIPPQLPAWFGGPVESRQGIILHNQLPQTGDTVITEGIALASVDSCLETLVAEETKRMEALSKLRAVSSTTVPGGMLPGFDALYPYRYLSGYAGWAPGQLENEIKIGAWLEIPLDRSLIFNTAWHNIWDRAMGTLGISATDLAPAQRNNSWLN